jgi:hypothetical protein
MAKYFPDPLLVGSWQRRLKNRADILAQVIRVAGPEQDHLDARLMPGKAISGFR